jgi:hypothetical protein
VVAVEVAMAVEVLLAQAAAEVAQPAITIKLLTQELLTLEAVVVETQILQGLQQ